MLLAPGLHVGNDLFGLLGTADAGMVYGLENARLVGREVREFYWRRERVDISLGYATAILRQFREHVLDYFFATYPNAAFIDRWRQLALAVAVFTRDPVHGLYWQPGRAAVVDAVQKQRLLHSSTTMTAHFRVDTNRLMTYNVTGRLVSIRTIKPAPRFGMGGMDIEPHGTILMKAA